MKKTDSKIIIALDYADKNSLMTMVEKLDPSLCKLKIGFESFLHGGPKLVEKLQSMGYDVFLDLKFHDIPNTVASACRAAAELDVWMLNVHAAGGEKMLNAAREAVDKSNYQPLLIAVTVLTSMGDKDIQAIGYSNDLRQQTIHFASIAQQAQFDGVVCSAQDIAFLSNEVVAPFLWVTPGIRLASDDKGDQTRIMTPASAINAGSDYLVIGRSVTNSHSPIDTLNEILLTIP